MKILFLTITAAILLSACGAPVGNNAPANNANKPANAANGNSNSAPANNAAVEAEIKKTLDDFAGALNKGDAAGLDKFYRDDYVLIDQDGAVQTKASRIEGIKSGKVKFEGLKFEDLKFKVNPAGDAAVVYGHVTGKNTIDGKSEDRNSMVTWIVVKDKDKGWQFINAQITDIKGGGTPPKSEGNTAGANANK
ncbi:MAG: nuclear transport factor 2 family protein [Acidobacteria bacterium]|nr:nuclear transport factor 2 family protein [Acidobacteriota bacterium]